MPQSSLIFLPVLLFPLSLLAAPETVKVDVLQTKLDHPRSLAFLPDNKGLLITLKDGQLKHWQAGKGLSDPIVGVPKVWASGRGGLLDVALAPDFAQSQRVWLSFAEAGNDGKAGTAVGYGRLSDDLSRIEGFRWCSDRCRSSLPATTLADGWCSTAKAISLLARVKQPAPDGAGAGQVSGQGGAPDGGRKSAAG